MSAGEVTGFPDVEPIRPAPPADDAAAVRAVRERKPREPKKKVKPPAPESTAPISPQEQALWGKTVGGFFSKLADVRRPDCPACADALTIDPDALPAVADAAVLTARKYVGPAAVERPWIVLALALGPVVLVWIIEEVKHALRKRPTGTAASDGGEPGRRGRPDGERQDAPREEYVTKPFSLPGS